MKEKEKKKKRTEDRKLEVMKNKKKLANGGL